MKKIYACSKVCGKLSTLYIFESKKALISYAMNNGRGEATEGKPTINRLLNLLGMTRVYARELSKYKKLNSLHRYN